MAKIMEQNASLVYAVDGRCGESGDFCHYALTPKQLGKYAKHGDTVPMAQFFDLVGNGLIMTHHIFRGLKRPMCCADDMDADKQKIACTWKPRFDADWMDGSKSQIRRRKAPAGKVFAVLASPNTAKEKFPEVSYWIERWMWLPEDPNLAGAPKDYLQRYEEIIWQKGN